jgi:hypothetical protein
MRPAPRNLILVCLCWVTVTESSFSSPGKMWDSAGLPVAAPSPPPMLTVSPLSWPPPPGEPEYSSNALIVTFGEPGTEFSFLVYPSASPGEYWVAELTQAGRRVQGATAAREGRPFRARAGLTERIMSAPSESDWSEVMEAVSARSNPRAVLLRSLPRSLQAKSITVSPRLNPLAPSDPRSFPARELHLLILPTGEILEGVITSPARTD